MYLASPYLGQITKFNLNMQDFKRGLDLTCKLKYIELFNFLN